MNINEALTRANQEYLLGLAKLTPIRVKKASKKNVGRAERMDTFKLLLESLLEISEDHAAAGFSIAIGWRIRGNPVTLKTAQRMWGRVGGMGAQDSNDYIVDCQKKFTKWLDYTYKNKIVDKRNIAISVCAEGETFQQAGWKYQVSDKTAKKYAIQGVDAYVEANKKEYASIRAPQDIEFD